jgi:uncharacterized protein involved in outer membrane biogenesis
LARKTLITVIAAAIALTAIAVGVVLVGLPWAKEKALEQISATLGRRVVVEGDWDIDFGLPPTLRLERIRLANADWSEIPWMAEVAALEVSVDLGALVDGRIVIPKLHLVEPRVLLERAQDGRANWQFEGLQAKEPQPASDEGPAALPVIRDLVVTGTRVRYLDHASDTDLTAVLPRAEGAMTEERTAFTTHGEIDGRPLGVELSAGPLNQLDAEGQAFPLTAHVELDRLKVDIEGEARAPLRPAGIDLRFNVEGEGTPALVGIFTGDRPPDLPRYRLQGAIRQPDPQRWQLQDFEFRMGATAMRGSAGVDLSGERPDITADVTVPRLAVDELRRLANEFTDTPDSAEPQAAASETGTPDSPKELDLAALRAVNADISLRVEQVTGAEAPVGGGRLDLTLRDGVLEITPLQARVADNGLTLRGRLDASEPPATGRFTLSFEEVDLPATLSLFGVEQPPPGSVSGEVTVNITGDLNPDERDLALPGLGRVQIAPSRISYTAPETDTAVEARLRTEPRDGEPRVFISADGRYRGEAFTLEFAGDSPLALRDPSRPYALNLTLKAADTTLEAEGTVGVPLNGENLDLDLAIEGPDPERLSPLVGFPLPELPPYALAGHVTREGDAIRIESLDGRVGDSDMHGDVRVDISGDKPMVEATLRSRLLDFDDLAGLIGATPDAGPGETASPSQREEQRREENDSELFPDEPLKLDQVTSIMNANVDYRAQRVEAPGLPLDDVHFHIKVDDGLVRMTPLAFGVGEGAVSLELTLDTREQPFKAEIGGEVSRVNLQKALAPLEIADDSFGIIGGRLQFWVEGNSIADFFNSADGGLLLIMTGGRLDVLLVEVAGLDLTETVASLLGDVQSVPIDCAYLDVSARNGIAEIETAVVDTPDTIFLADGTLNFRQETLDLVLEPHPKDFSLFSLRTSLHAEGPMTSPNVAPGEELMARALATAALAAAAPVAALIPLIEPGTGEDSVYCNGLVEAIDRARAEN